MNEFTPEVMAFCPRLGPTISSCMIRAGAGNLPDCKTFTRSLASLMVKFPVMDERPPLISFCTVGKEYT